MPNYLVTWRIDIEADTPEEAAFHALAIQRRPDSTAVLFEVTDKDTGAAINVDLERDDDCPTCANRGWVIVQADLPTGLLGEIQRCDDCQLFPSDTAACHAARTAGFTVDGFQITAYPPGFSQGPSHEDRPPAGTDAPATPATERPSQPPTT